MANKIIRITHLLSNQVIAEGPTGWGITPFDGGYYIRNKFLRTDGFKPSFIPGVCVYKFLYVWLDFHWGENQKSRNIGWLYWLPNPLFPFIWFRVAVPTFHPELLIEEIDSRQTVI